jgi:hypothetical protein
LKLEWFPARRVLWNKESTFLKKFGQKSVAVLVTIKPNANFKTSRYEHTCKSH